MIIPYKNKVLVKNIEKMPEVRPSGILLSSDDGKSEGIRARWCQVYAIGEGVRDIEVNRWVLVHHGRWTRGMEHDGETIYMVDYPHGLLAVSETDEMPELRAVSVEKTAKEYQYSAKDFSDINNIDGYHF